LSFAAAGSAAAAGLALSAGGAGRLGAGRLSAHGRLGGGLGDLGDLGSSGGLGKGLGLGDVLDMPADGPGLEDPLQPSSFSGLDENTQAEYGVSLPASMEHGHRFGLGGGSV
jgi:hypothetical protein